MQNIIIIIIIIVRFQYIFCLYSIAHAEWG